MGDVLGDHGLAESVGRDQDDVTGAVEEIESERGFDRGAVDLLGPVPVVVGNGFESAEVTSGEAALEALLRAVVHLERGDVLEELGGAPALLGGERDDVVEVRGEVAKADVAEQLGEGHLGSSFGLASPS